LPLRKVGWNSPLPDDLRRCAEAALAMAESAEPDEALNMPGPMPESPPTSLFDPALAELPIRRLHEIASEFPAELKADPRLSVDSGQVSWIRDEEGFVNSHGVSRRETSTLSPHNFTASAGEDLGAARLPYLLIDGISVTGQ
jgi:predicted Zn-dependent protease